ncbi:hypothetical protein B4U80_12688 [Leptotrombidium deliense]|uniref:Chromo domain-containing protein n=1 Tax=Leptotrombidium deliense TaxID=299467 RepID=A0A443SQS4_9ACAR|nr:hypothetical protein B4U80_12688 [Leptotrombidium deliense]
MTESRRKAESEDKIAADFSLVDFDRNCDFLKNDELIAVHKVIDKKNVNGFNYYCVTLNDWDDSENAWIGEEDFSGHDLITQFEERCKVDQLNNIVETKWSESENWYQVDRVIDKKIVNGCTYYYVHWKGCQPKENTWESAENVADKCLVKQYESQRCEGESILSLSL